MGSGRINKNNNDLSDLRALEDARSRNEQAEKADGKGRRSVRSARPNAPQPTNLLTHLRDREIGRRGANWQSRVLRDKYGPATEAAAVRLASKCDAAQMIEEYKPKLAACLKEFEKAFPQFCSTTSLPFRSLNIDGLEHVDIFSGPLFLMEFRRFLLHALPPRAIEGFVVAMATECTLGVLEKLMEECRGQDGDAVRRKFPQVLASVTASVFREQLLAALRCSDMNLFAGDADDASIDKKTAARQKSFRKWINPVLVELCLSKDIEKASEAIKVAKANFLSELKNDDEGREMIADLNQNRFKRPINIRIPRNFSYGHIKNRNFKEHAQTFLEAFMHCRFLVGQTNSDSRDAVSLASVLAKITS